MADVLTARALNRATLARQLLLERVDRPPIDVVAWVVGMQAQVPLNPYTALWSRLTAFDPGVIAAGLEDRSLVRIACLRGTVHLVTADDCLELWPLSRPVLMKELRIHQDTKKLGDVDLTPVLAFAAARLDEQPRTPTQLRQLLADEFPDLHAPGLAYACRNHLALVQVPPRGVWGKALTVTYARAEHWLDRPLASAPSLEGAIARYLAAFGPATAADVNTWCRLTGLAEVLEGMDLRRFADERGRTLWDVPDGELADPDVDAPVRFLPEYDNATICWADKSRMGFEGAGAAFDVERPGFGGVLVDGLVTASWRVVDGAIVVRHVGLAKRAQKEVATEGAALAGFLGLDPGVRFEVAP